VGSLPQKLPYRERVSAGIDRRFVFVADAQPAAEIDVTQRGTLCFEHIDEREHLPRGLDVHGEIRDLRPMWQSMPCTSMCASPAAWL
jgi:hypothetical protein